MPPKPIVKSKLRPSQLLVALGIGMRKSSQRPPNAFRVSKQAVVYLHTLPDEAGYQTQYQCRDCPMFIYDTERCTIHGCDDEIEPYGTCGYWIPGRPVSSEEFQPAGHITKLQSGYTENKVGFSCKRCMAFAAKFDSAGNLSKKGGCAAVDYNTPGDDPGRIDPNACCAAWNPDAEVGDMPTKDFPRIV